MDGNFFANNWFSVFTLFCIAGGWLVHYGVSRQRGTQTADAVEEIKTALKEEVAKIESSLDHEVEKLSTGILANAAIIQTHINNSDAHVTPIFLELLKTRHDFITQQLSDARHDIQRIESIVAK